MFFTRIVVAVLTVVLAATGPAFAAEPSHMPETRLTTGALRPIGPLRASIDRVRFDRDPDIRREAVEGEQISTPTTVQSSGVLGKIVMAGVLGVAGFLGGGYLGAKIEGPCDCDDPGFKGAIIGAPIGATVGAIAGWKLGGLLGR